MKNHHQQHQSQHNLDFDVQHRPVRSKLHALKRAPILVVGPSIAYIPLTKGQSALIDSDDLLLVGGFNWYAQWNGNTKSFYAFREVTGGQKLGMHGFLLSPGEGYFPDHINGLTLDNRRSNLRAVTTSQNGMNRGVRSDSSTGLRGVSPAGRKFQAAIKVEGKRKYLGSFPTAQVAYEAYCAAAVQFHGEYRREL